MANSRSVPGKQNRHLPAFILLFLAESDTHGGAIWNRLSEMTPAHSDIDSGAVYRVLRDLEARHCVTSSWNTEDLGPARRIYHITVEGMAELDTWYQDICLRKKNLEYFIYTYESVRSEGANQEMPEGRHQEMSE